MTSETPTVPRTGGRDRGRTAFGGLAVVLTTVAVAVLAAGALPGRVRIHWTLGLGPYVGPEFAPTAPVLAAFPLLAAGLFALGRLAAGRLEDADGTAASYCRAGTLVALLAVLLVEVALVAANLA